MIVAGIGCRAGCPAGEIMSVIQAAEALARCRVDRLAAPDFKATEAGLAEAARLLGLTLSFVDGPALQAVQHLCPTRSQQVQTATGFASVAEGAALAASGGTLLLARIAHARATCALAHA